MNIENKKQMVRKGLNQEAELPKEAIDLLNEEIILYALADLDEDFSFTEKWVVLTKNKLTLIKKEGPLFNIEKEIILNEIVRIKEVTSLACITYNFISSDDCPSLLTIRFTRRQKVIMGHIKFLLEDMIKNNYSFSDDLEFNSNEKYIDGLLKPIFDAQDGISSNKSKTFLRLVSYLLPYKRQLFWGSIGAVGATLVSLIPAYVSGYLIDDIISPFQNGQLPNNEAIKMAWILVATIASVKIIREFFSWVRLKKMSMIGEDVARDLRTELYAHLQTLNMDFYSRKQTGSIISRVSSDTDRIWDFVAFGVVEVAVSLITIIGLSSVLIYLDWKLGLVMTLPIPILLCAIFWHGEKMKKIFLKAWRKWSDLTNVLSDTIPGIQIVKAFNQEDKEINRFEERNQIVTNEFKNVHLSWTRFWPSLMLGIHAIMISVWAFATPRLLSDQTSLNHLSSGTFISFLLYMTMFSAPIEVIGQVARMLNRALSSAYRIFEILDTRPTILKKENAVKLNSLKGDIEFKNVSFSYDGIRPILKNISFKVKQGEMIGLVGESGGGKSTITKLISRFYDVNSGEILVDGHSLKDLELGLFRQQVGLVLQDPYLFHGTILSNISYGAENASLADIINAAKVANVHNFIGGLPYGYDTIVGERGHTLSGGERQRISIARAVLHNPKVLILDEATSAVDTETERNIQDALDKLVKGRTVFAIAHRLSTLRKADRIFVIEKGEIKEQGKHQELLTKEDGIYRKLHKMQQEMSEHFAL